MRDAENKRKRTKQQYKIKASFCFTFSSWAEGSLMISMGGGRGVWGSSSASSSPPLFTPRLPLFGETEKTSHPFLWIHQNCHWRVDRNLSFITSNSRHTPHKTCTCTGSSFTCKRLSRLKYVMPGVVPD